MSDGATVGIIGFVVIVAAVLGILAVTSIPSEKLSTCSANQYGISEAKTGAWACAAVSIANVTGSVVNSLNGLTGAVTLGHFSSLNMTTAGNTITLGLDLTHANIWTATQSEFGGTWNVLHAAADVNPTASLGDGFLKFGAGGASTLDVGLSWTSAGAVTLRSVGTATQFSVLQFRQVSGGTTYDAADFSFRPANANSATAITYTFSLRGTGVAGQTNNFQLYAYDGTSFFNLFTMAYNGGSPLVQFQNGIFSISTTGIGNTQGFQSFNCTPTITTTSKVCNLPVTEPDTSYFALCEFSAGTISGAVTQVVNTSTSTITVNFPTTGLGDTLACIVTHQ